MNAQPFARSALFVPATQTPRIPKALASGADAVIVDLEDAVAPQDKDAARMDLQGALHSMPGPIWVRVNSDPEWMAADLAMCAHSAAVTGVMVPKAETVDQMQLAFERSGGKPLLALIETAAGFEARQALASHPAVARLAFGSIDFQLDLGIDGDDEALLMFRSALVLASRLAGRPAPLDGVTVEVSDMQPVEADARRARQLGFGGKLCIHPRQVEVVNAAFSPTAEQLLWAQRVLTACEAAGGAAVAVDGKMVDKPVLLLAQALLAQRR